ncbi:MAG: DUF1877 family protein [Acidobacteriota bacterium]
MGMVLLLHTLRDENIERVLEDPPLVWLVLDSEDTSLYIESRMERSETLPDRGWPTLDFSEQERVEADLDKAWHGLHYLFFQLGEGADQGDTPASGFFGRLKQAIFGAGKSQLTKEELHEDRGPHCFLLAGGSSVGDLEVGTGSARVFTSEQVAEIHALLSSWDEDRLRAVFSPAEMRRLEIYPEIWGNSAEEHEESFGYCLESFSILREFSGEAVDGGMGLVLHLE